MAHVQNGVYEDEARETVDDLLETYDVPPEIRQEVEQQYAEGHYFAALDTLIKRR